MHFFFINRRLDTKSRMHHNHIRIFMKVIVNQQKKNDFWKVWSIHSTHPCSMHIHCFGCHYRFSSENNSTLRTIKCQQQCTRTCITAIYHNWIQECCVVWESAPTHVYRVYEIRHWRAAVARVFSCIHVPYILYIQQIDNPNAPVLRRQNNRIFIYYHHFIYTSLVLQNLIKSQFTCCC